MRRTCPSAPNSAFVAYSAVAPGGATRSRVGGSVIPPAVSGLSPTSPTMRATTGGTPSKLSPCSISSARAPPPAGLAAYVRAAARTCRAPGCDRPSHRCDLDHRYPFPRNERGRPDVTPGGPQISEHSGSGEDRECAGCTSSHNLDPACRRHHLLKTHHGFSVATGPDPGTRTWRTPSGRTYTTYAHDYRPDG